MSMDNRQDRATQKGIDLAAAIAVALPPSDQSNTVFRVTTERGGLTKVTISLKLSVPDAAGRGGGVPSG